MLLSEAEVLEERRRNSQREFCCASWGSPNPCLWNVVCFAARSPSSPFTLFWWRVPLLK